MRAVDRVAEPALTRENQHLPVLDPRNRAESMRTEQDRAE